MMNIKMGGALASASTAALLAVSSLAGAAMASDPPAGSRGLAVAATDVVH